MSSAEIVKLQDIGDFTDVEIIELLVGVGDTIAVEDSILTLESDKATMEVPSLVAGTIEEVLVSIGDKISQGDALLKVKVSEGAGEEAAEPEDQPAAPEPEQPAEAPATEEAPQPAPQPDAPPAFAPSPPPVINAPQTPRPELPYASPGVRKFARELGADLAQVSGSGKKGRITKDDVKAFVKQSLQSGAPGAGGARLGPPPLPEVDFSKFGATESLALSKIKRITGDRLHRSWLDIPHVTHHDEADITELEKFRKSIANEFKSTSNRITVLSFIVKATVHALKEFPTFNASLSADAQSLILKKYFNIGIAVDTPNGLVVPVVRGVENIGVREIAALLQETGEKAREGRLTPSDFEGGCFTISSLGGIGGRFFTPIINPPEVAILGVSRHHSVLAPSDDGIHANLHLPLSLSYDHRVIDGAEAARFTASLCEALKDPRRILL